MVVGLGDFHGFEGLAVVGSCFHCKLERSREQR